jgi:hypothetical protein
MGAGLAADLHDRHDKYSEFVSFLPPATGLLSPSSHFLRLNALMMSDFIGGGIPAATSSSFWSDFPTMDIWEKVQSFP